MSVLGGIPHNGKGPASSVFTGCTSWEEFCQRNTAEFLRNNPSVKFFREVDEDEDKTTSDTVNPSHYIGHNGLECHAVQRAVLGQAGMGAYWHGCAIKYVFRAIKKNGSEDIKKAIRCLQFWLDEVTPNESQREKLS